MSLTVSLLNVDILVSIVVVNESVIAELAVDISNPVTLLKSLISRDNSLEM